MRSVVLCLIVILSISGVTSCASKRINYEKQYILINPGMTKEEVIEIMGYPGNRQFEGYDEAWQYHKNGFWEGRDRIYIIWLYKGIVTGLTTRSMPTTGSAIYIPINWKEKPDYSIEIRNR